MTHERNETIHFAHEMIQLIEKVEFAAMGFQVLVLMAVAALVHTLVARR